MVLSLINSKCSSARSTIDHISTTSLNSMAIWQETIPCIREVWTQWEVDTIIRWGSISTTIVDTTLIKDKIDIKIMEISSVQTTTINSTRTETCHTKDQTAIRCSTQWITQWIQCIPIRCTLIRTTWCKAIQCTATPSTPIQITLDSPINIHKITPGIHLINNLAIIMEGTLNDQIDKIISIYYGCISLFEFFSFIVFYVENILIINQWDTLLLIDRNVIPLNNSLHF